MRIILWATLLVLFGCSNDNERDLPEAPKPPEVIREIEPEAEIHVNEFYWDAFIRGVYLKPDLIVVYVDVFKDQPEPNNIIGYCYDNPRVPVVALRRSFFLEANDLNRKMLIYHELGHCVLDRSHSDSYFSIMYPLIMSTDNTWYLYIQYFQKEYIDELFNLTKPHDYSRDRL